MKALLLKDYYMIVKYTRIFLFMVILFLVITSFSGDSGSFMIAYPLLMAAILPVSLLSYDEKFHWDSYCCTTPISRKTIVSEKYVLTLILVGSVFVLTALLQLRLALRGAMDIESYFAILDTLMSIAFLAPSLMLPVIFKLGMEKGRMAYYVVFGLAFVAVMMAGKFSDSGLFFKAGPLSTLLILLVCLAVYGVSWLLSIKFYQAREL